MASTGKRTDFQVLARGISISVKNVGPIFYLFAIVRIFLSILDAAVVLGLGAFSTLIDSTTLDSFSPLLAEFLKWPLQRIGEELTLSFLILSLVAARTSVALFSTWIEARYFSLERFQQRSAALRSLGTFSRRSVVDLDHEDLLFRIKQSIDAKYVRLPKASLDLMSNGLLAIWILLLISISNPGAVILAGAIVVSTLLIQQRLIGRKISVSSKEIADLEVTSNEIAFKSIKGFREFSSPGLFWGKASDLYEKTLANQVPRLIRLQFISSIPAQSYQVIVILSLVGAVLASSQSGNSSLSVGGLTILVAGLVRLGSAISPIETSLNSAREGLGQIRELPKNGSDDYSKIGSGVPTTRELAPFYISAADGSEIKVTVRGTLPETGVVLVKGYSGAGKTSLLDVLAGLRAVQKLEIGGLSVPRFGFTTTSDGVAYVSSRPELMPVSIAENICFTHFQGKICPDALELVRSSRLIKEFEDNMDKVPTHLSSGQNSRLAVLRAVHSNPKVLLLDEVAANLDPQNRKLLFGLIEKLRADCLVVMVSHDEGKGITADLTIEVGT